MAIKKYDIKKTPDLSHNVLHQAVYRDSHNSLLVPVWRAIGVLHDLCTELGSTQPEYHRELVPTCITDQIQYFNGSIYLCLFSLVQELSHRVEAR